MPKPRRWRKRSSPPSTTRRSSCFATVFRPVISVCPGNVFAAFFELFPDQAGVRNTVAMIREKRLSQSLLFVTLSAAGVPPPGGGNGANSRLLTDKDAWLRMLSEGATRTFEGWYKDQKWNTSLFHLTMSLGRTVPDRLGDGAHPPLLPPVKKLSGKAQQADAACSGINRRRRSEPGRRRLRRPRRSGSD